MKQPLGVVWPYMWIKESRCYLVTALMVLGVDIFASTSLPFCFKTIVEGFERKETLDALMGLAGVFFITTLIYYLLYSLTNSLKNTFASPQQNDQQRGCL